MLELSSIGARVRAVRRRQSISQKQLAALAGCSQQTIVDVETQGTRSKFLPAIARALGESLDWLETGSGAAPGAQDRLPHFDLWSLPTHPEAPIDRIFVDPTGRGTFTVSVDAATAARSGGLLRAQDALVCRPLLDHAPSAPLPQWVIAWAPMWRKAEIARLGESEGTLYLAPPADGPLDLARPVSVVLDRAAAATAPAPEPGAPLTVWLCAEVLAIVREL